MMRSQRSSVISSNVRRSTKPPALFTSTSTRPNFSSISATIRFTSSESETSPRTAKPSLPAAFTSSTTSRASSSLLL